MNIYLLVGLLVHVAFLGLADWLAYRHLVKHGYDHTVLILGVLNVAIVFGVYYPGVPAHAAARSPAPRGS